MRRIIGGLFLVAGAILLYYFGVMGAAKAGGEVSFGMPFKSLGSAWPGDTLLFLGSAWLILIGFVLVLFEKKKIALRPSEGSAAARFAAQASANRSAGFIAKMLLVNGMLLLSAIFVAAVGARTNQDVGMIGVFGGTALAMAGCGLFLAIFTLMEKPKAPVTMIAGLLLWIGGSALSAVAFVQGM